MPTHVRPRDELNSSRLGQGILAGYLLQLWTAAIGLVFVPVYINYLGMEGYGIVGLFVTLQVWLAVLDFGLPTALNREVARLSVGEGDVDSTRDLFRTIEFACLALAGSVFALSAFSSGWIVNHWIKPGTTELEGLATSASILGAAVAVRMLESPYRNVLYGLQRTVLLGGVSAGMTTIRAAGAVWALQNFSTSLQAFAIWQLIASVVSVTVMRSVAAGSLPPGSRSPRASIASLRNCWRFSSAIALTTVMSTLITQGDKLLLSGILGLHEYGTYVFSWAVVGLLFQAIGPISSSLFPHLSAQVAAGDAEGIESSYHGSAQLMSVVISPVAAILMLYSQPLLLAWTSDPVLSNSTSGLIAVLSAGTLLNGLVHVPYMMQLASGWPGLATSLNVAIATVMLPSILIFVPAYGAMAAAWIWFCTSLFQLVVGPALMHRRILPGGLLPWATRDVLAPSLTAVCTVAVSRFAQPDALEPLAQLLWCGCSAIIAAIAALSASPQLRPGVIRMLRRNRS